MVFPTGPEAVHHPVSLHGLNTPWLVETLRRSIKHCRPVFKPTCGWATPPLHPPDINHVMDNTRPSRFFCATPMQTEEQKNGLGLETRLDETVTTKEPLTIVCSVKIP